jgi:hypothetical protein
VEQYVSTFSRSTRLHGMALAHCVQHQLGMLLLYKNNMLVDDRQHMGSVGIEGRLVCLLGAGGPGGTALMGKVWPTAGAWLCCCFLNDGQHPTTGLGSLHILNEQGALNVPMHMQSVLSCHAW